MSQRVRIFVGTPKDYSDTASFVANLHKTLSQGATVPIELVSGADDYHLNVARYSGWEGWIQSVATGVEYLNGQLVPRFDAIFVGPSVELGKATARIVQLALKAKKDVFHYDGSIGITKVSEIVQQDPGNFSSGWAVN